MVPALLLVTVLVSSPATAAPAAELDAATRAEVEHVRTWTQNAAILGAVREQNALKVSLSRIRSIDITWMTASEPDPRMQALLKNPCAKSVQALTAARPGYREAFVMDNQGALVCMTRRTSDYWQGDEDKWRKSFAGGKGATWVSEPQLDESTGVRLIHVSVPILDGGKAIGVVTAGIDSATLRQQKR